MSTADPLSLMRLLSAMESAALTAKIDAARKQGEKQ